jgi:tetratricopeptide (TPR) repeat protein
MTYGYLAEADIALGNYPEAETNAQWMMNMRPNNTPALLVGARLRTLYGDAHGAIDFLNRAYSQTSPAEVEDLAWIANQIASIQIESGQIDAAAQTLEQAEQLFPALSLHDGESGARSHGQNRASDAVQLWMQAARSIKIRTFSMNWQKRRRPQDRREARHVCGVRETGQRAGTAQPMSRNSTSF